MPPLQDELMTLALINDLLDTGLHATQFIADLLDLVGRIKPTTG